MRFLRLLFVTLLAIVLIAVALANREMVVLNAFPANFGQYVGGTWSVTLPLFLVIFLAMALGVAIGLIWEWLRETHIRREARQRSEQVARLEREVGTLRESHAVPRDEVLAIVDAPRATPPQTSRPITSGASAAALPSPTGR